MIVFCESVNLEFGVFLSIFSKLLALSIISSAYKLPSPFLASVLTTSLSLSLNSSLNFLSVMLIGLIPRFSGNTYFFLELMFLLLNCFRLRGNIMLFSSSKRIIFPLSNNSTMIVYILSFLTLISMTRSKLC